MPELTFYCLIGSPSSRSVLYVAQHLGIELNVMPENLESIAFNPARLSILDDGGTRIYDSGAIMIYLVEKYGQTDQLYPKDLVRRAKVNAMLFFETQFLFGRLRTAVESIFESSGQQPHYLIDKVIDSLIRLERILDYNGTEFLADNSITICDFVCISTLLSIEVFLNFDHDTYPRIAQWRNRMNQQFPEMERIEKQNALDFKLLIEEVIQVRMLTDPEKTETN